MTAWNRCNGCGKFVGYQAILDGKATVSIVYFGMDDERTEIECQQCKEKDDAIRCVRHN